MATTADVAKSLGLITPDKKKQKPASLFQQALSGVAGVMPGAVHLGALIAKETAAPIRSAWDFAHGDASVGDVAGSLLHATQPGATIGAGIAGSGNTPHIFGSEKYQPASFSQGQSFRNTYEDVIHPSRFKQASDQGAIFGKVLEDVGNVSMVAGGAGAVLEGVGEGTGAAARFAQQAAPIAKRIETLGAKGLDAATIAPYRAAFRGAGKLAQAALEAAPEESRLAAGAARMLDPVLRGEKRLASEGNVRGRLASDKTVGEVNKLRTLAGSDEVFEASRARLTALDQPIAEAVKAGPLSADGSLLPAAPGTVAPGFVGGKITDGLLRTLYPDQVEGYGIRPEIGQMLADYHAGTLDPAVAEQIDKTTTAMRAVEDKRTMAALRGEGFSSKGGSLDPAQLGTGPITTEADTLGKVRERVEKRTGEKVDVAERKLRRAQDREVVPGDFTRRDVERTVLTEARQRRAFRPSPNTPAIPGTPSVLARDLGVVRDPESLVRPVTETARRQGAALGLAAAADDTAARAARRPSTTLVDIQAGEGAAATDRAGKLGWRQTREGRLSERARQASADAEAALVGMPEEVKTATRQQAQEAHALDQMHGGSEGWADLAGMPGARKLYQAIDAETRLSDAGGATGAAQDVLTAGVDRAVERGAAVGREQGATAQLHSEADLLGRRAERAYERAQASGDLREAALQAQAQQAASSFSAGRRAERASVRRATAEEGVTVAKEAQRQALEHIDAKLEKARTNPQNYPARWRPVMEAQSRWVEHLKRASDAAGSPQDKALLAEMAADVPLLPDELAARGLDPSHVTQGYLSDVKRETTAARLTNSLTPERKLAAENLRGAGSDVPTGAKQTADREAQQAATRIHNEVMQGLLEPMQVDAAGKAIMDPATNTPTGYSRTAKSVLGDDGLAQVLEDARAKAQAERPGNGAWARRRTSEAVHAAMLEKGWEAFDPQGGQTGRFALAKEMVNPDSTVYLKKGSAQMLDNYLVPKNMSVGLQAMHAINTKWKGLVLPFSVRWQIGDAVGNTVMAWAGGGVPPWEIASKLGEAKAALERGEIPDRVATHGLATDDAVQLGLREADRVPRTPIGKGLKAFQGKAFGLNETINKMQRSAFYLAKLEEFGGAETAGAVERAIHESNRVMGDFANLSPVERRWVSQVFPFWSWIRHITRLAGSVAIDNPARMVHMLRLSAIYADDQVDLPGWAKGGLPIGNNVIPLRGLEPFGDVFGGPAMPLSGSGGVGGANALRALSPAIKLASVALTGKNLSRENMDLTSPNARKDEYGHDVPTPLLAHPLELLRYATDQVPIARTLRDLAPNKGVAGFEGGPVLRYDTGETRKRKGQPVKGDTVLGGRTDVAARTLIPFFPQVVNASQQKAIAAKRRRS